MKVVRKLMLQAAVVCQLLCWAQGQTFTMMHAFNGPPSDGANPFGGVVSDGQGNWYGAAETGGASCCGAIYKLDSAGQETILYNFTGGVDQGFPSSTLLRDSAGNLYGTTQHGLRSGYGTVFRLSPVGKLSNLHVFTGGPDGATPFGSLIRDGAGNLYGVTSNGGDLSCADGSGYGCGVIFKLDRSSNETVLFSFHNLSNGEFPVAELARDAFGNLYGTTPTGGDANCNAPFGCGVVFKLDTAGNETILHRFAGGTTDGAFPEAGLIFDAQGNLYGTAAEGGNTGCAGIGCGIVFKVDQSGNETILYRFAGSPADGAYPNAQLSRDAAGHLYGTTKFGGDSQCQPLGCGTAFNLRAKGKETVLHFFAQSTDGGAPLAPLVRDSAGNFYGTTSNWGPSTCNQFGCGTVFKITPQ